MCYHCLGFGIRLSGFKLWLFHLVVLISGKLFNLSVSLFTQLQNGDSTANSQRSCENK